MNGLTGRGGATSEEFGRDPSSCCSSLSVSTVTSSLWKRSKWPSVTSWRSLFSSRLIRLLHGRIDGCLCRGGWSQRSSRSGSGAGVSAVLGHDTEILCLSSLPAGFLRLRHVCCCLQSGRKFIRTSVVRGFSESSRGRSCWLRLGPEEKG